MEVGFETLGKAIGVESFLCCDEGLGYSFASMSGKSTADKG
jgi:hypothetical protein